MDVQFTRINPATWRWDPKRHLPFRAAPFASAVVDGHVVKVRPQTGWTCECPNPECEHADAVADLIHPNMLRALEGTAPQATPTHIYSPANPRRTLT